MRQTPDQTVRGRPFSPTVLTIPVGSFLVRDARMWSFEHTPNRRSSEKVGYTGPHFRRHGTDETSSL